MTIIIHDGKFHADDVFAVAVLELATDKQAEIIRTRDPEIIKTGDYVVDVGEEYDPDKNRFDHHQIDMEQSRQNGIPYASFGLVWKKYGGEICGSKQVADMIDKKLIQTVDAGDNGILVYEQVYPSVSPYLISDFINVYISSWKEDDRNEDDAFREAVDMAKFLLKREISKTRDYEEVEEIIEKIYNETEDKRLIVLDAPYPVKNILMKYKEPLFIVLPSRYGSRWVLGTVKKDENSFENRKDLPESWAGKSNENLANITGVSDALFCHKNRFMATAGSRQSAVAMAKLALEDV